MNTMWKYLPAFVCLLLGIAGIVFMLSSEEATIEVTPLIEVSDPVASPVQESANTELSDEESSFPEGAISGERTIHFTSQEEYQAYLKLLSDAGLNPLGTIDSLLAVRISSDVLNTFNPGLHGGEQRFSYRVEQPLPPVELNPELLVQLRAFGVSAREIVGGQFEGDGSGILVGILDSGIGDHVYFEGVDIDSIDLTGKGVSAAGSGHGTSVASIIAGKEGIAPAADLLVVRVLDDQGIGNSFDVAKGIIHAVDRGATLINLSLGVYQDTQVLRQAVQYAQTQGVVLIAAAGNDGYSRLPYPAAYPQVLSVTAIDGRGQQAVFPNKSKAIDFAAPGVGIFAVGEGDEKEYFSGTSAAAPFVTGTLAALLTADPNLSPEGAVNLIKGYLDEAGAVGADPVYGGGLLNWDRLRERSTKDVADVALASIHLTPEAQPGTMMPIEVTVQNRGTRWLSVAELTVLVGESVPQDFTVGTLAPGQTTTRKVHTQVPAMQSDEVLEIAAQVLAENALEDVRPQNNVKTVLFKPIKR